MSDILLRTGNFEVNKAFLIPNVISTIQKVIEIGFTNKRKKINQFFKHGFYFPNNLLCSWKQYYIKLRVSRCYVYKSFKNFP